MAVSDSFRTFVMDQIGRVAPKVRTRSMFGGVGIYSADHFFGLIDDDVIYLKVDDMNRPDFVARGMKPFAPFGEGGEVMQYYRLPEELLDEADDLRPWVAQAIDVAARKKKRKAKTPSRANAPKTKAPKKKTPKKRKPQ